MANELEPTTDPGQPVVYQIRLKGHLGADWAGWFGGKNGGKLSFDLSASSEEMERFLASADYEFECAKIVGRKFVDVHDHASYLCAGGCVKIIEAIAALQQPGQYECGGLD